MKLARIEYRGGIYEATVTCNGQWLLVGYDPERNRIEWEKDEDLPGGPKELTFIVRDNAGNSTTVTRKIAPPAPKPKRAPARTR